MPKVFRDDNSDEEDEGDGDWMAMDEGESGEEGGGSSGAPGGHLPQVIAGRGGAGAGPGPRGAAAAARGAKKRKQPPVKGSKKKKAKKGEGEWGAGQGTGTKGGGAKPPRGAGGGGKGKRKQGEAAAEEEQEEEGEGCRKNFSEWVRSGPPPSIRMSTAATARTPEHWATEAGAKEAADCQASMDVGRLAGSLDIALTAIDAKGGASLGGGLGALLAELSRPVARTSEGVGLGYRQIGRQWWDTKTGEPGSEGTIPIGRLIEACGDEGPLAADSTIFQVMVAMNALVVPGAVDELIPWMPQPLIRVVIPAASASVSESEGTIRVKAHVYLSRLVFYLIAFRPIQTVLCALDPCAGVRTRASLPALEAPIFKSEEAEGHEADFAFTLPGIMKSMEHAGYPSAAQPQGLALVMKEYQLQTLQWMQDREGLSHGLNELFWEQRAFADNGHYYFAPQLGELRLERPQEWRGGILSEEMGMGKTLEMLALILASKHREPPPPPPPPRLHGPGAVRIPSSATLIVVPNHLVSQWMDEIARCVAGDGLLTAATHVYPGDKVSGKCPGSGKGLGCPLSELAGGFCPGHSAHKWENVRQLANSTDVLVTTYQTLEKEKGIFAAVEWKRVVLDEMQEIRSSTTELAKACRSLPCSRRWMVSGTPLYTSVDDLNGELSFLGVLPFCQSDSVDGFWGFKIAEPLKRREPEALTLLHTLLDAVMMRHSKSQKYCQGGGRILDLPPATNRTVAVELAPSELYVNRYLEAAAAKELHTLLDRIAGGAEGEDAVAASGPKGSTQLWLRILREACISCTLINPQLREIDARMRYQSGSLAGLMGEESAGQIRSMEPLAASTFLMQARDVSETAKHHQGNHMVRHEGQQAGIYDRARSYAMKSVAERLVEVHEQRSKLEEGLAAADRDLPKLRWKLAFEAITSGRYIDPTLRLNSLRQLRKAVARLKALDNNKQPPASANGMRVVFFKANKAFDSDISGESIAKNEQVAQCAYTRAGWRALGVPYREGYILVAKVRIEQTSNEVIDGLNRIRYAVRGSIFAVPKAVLDPVKVHALAGLLETTRKKIAECRSEVAEYCEKLRVIGPYLAILERAKAAGAGMDASETVEQSGFTQLYEIEQGGAPTCCICQEGCGYDRSPTFMRCAHFGCEDCIVKWLQFEQSQQLGGPPKATCPLCRKHFALKDLIRIVKPAAPPDAADGKAKANASSSRDGGGGSSSSATAGGSRGGTPKWTPAATMEGLKELHPPPEGYLRRGQIPGLNNFPALSPHFATHLHLLCGMDTLGARGAGGNTAVISSKIRRFLEDLAPVTAAGRKAVVFTQHKHAVAHLSKVLHKQEIKHLKIVRGDHQAHQEDAVRDFNRDPDIKVFLLHAGQAAAGLTLTAASHVFLMEPFLRAGEELQAMNRCHRIGQQNKVSCTIYYHPGTIEERMLAYRKWEGAEGADDALSVLDHEQSGSVNAAKLRFLLGIDREGGGGSGGGGQGGVVG